MIQTRADDADRRLLLYIILAVAALKLAFAVLVLPHFEATMSASYGVDRGDLYDRLAKHLLEGDGYRFAADSAPTLLREPGYPLFLAAISTFSGYSLLVVRIANLLLTSLSALMIASLARRVSRSRCVYVLAPTLFLLHPGVMIAELRAAVEVLFIFVLLCFFLLVSRALKSGAVRDYLFAGLLLGLVSSVRSTVLLFPLGLPIYFLLWKRKSAAAQFVLGRMAVLYLACLVILAPWIARNYALVGEFVPTATVLGTSLHSGYYMCTHDDGTTPAAMLDLEGARARQQMAAQLGYVVKDRNMYYPVFYNSRDEVSFNRALTKWVLSQYRAAPALFAKCATENAFNFWFKGKSRAITAINAAVQLPYLLLGLIGIRRSYRSGDADVVGPLILFLLYLYAVYVPILAQARYSIPLVPVLAIFAAIPLCAGVSRLSGSAARREQ